MSCIAVDFDGTLAHYEGWKGIWHVGKPIPEMVDRVKGWLDSGIKVRIFTARVSSAKTEESLKKIEAPIIKWCIKHIGVELPITCKKTMDISEFWDDRAIQVVPNTGERVGNQESPREKKERQKK